MCFIYYRDAVQRFIVHLQYNNVQGYTSPALFNAAIIADRICVLNLKTNRRRCTNKVSNPMFSTSRDAMKWSDPAHDCINILKILYFFVILTLFIAINRFSTFFRQILNNDYQVSLNS